jgi:hypothetical protein
VGMGMGAGVGDEGMYSSGDMRLLVSMPAALACAAATMAVVDDAPRAMWYSAGTGTSAVLIPFPDSGALLALHGYGQVVAGQGALLAALYDGLCGTRSIAVASQTLEPAAPEPCLEALVLLQAVCQAVSDCSHGVTGAAMGGAVGATGTRTGASMWQRGGRHTSTGHSSTRMATVRADFG